MMLGGSWRLDQHDHPQCGDQPGQPGHLQAAVQSPQPGGEDQLRGDHPDQEQGGLVSVLGHLRVHHLDNSASRQGTIICSVQRGRISCEGSQRSLFYNIFYNYPAPVWWRAIIFCAHVIYNIGQVFVTFS